MRTQPGAERGFSLVEMLVALGLIALMATILGSSLFTARNMKAVTEPRMERLAVENRLQVELGEAAAGGARLRYVARDRTLAPILPSAGEGTATFANAGPAPPPPSPDPKPPSGGGGGGGSSPPTIDVDADLEPVTTFGAGIMVGGLAVAGPVSVIGEPLTLGQVGPSILTIRTDPRSPEVSLAEPFSTLSGVIRLVARDGDDLAAVLAFREGDVLVLNGRAAGVDASAVVEIVSAPHEVSRKDAFATVEASVRSGTASLRAGLRNNAAAAAGLEISDDAEVVLLDRAGPVVSYATLRVESDGQAGITPRGDPRFVRIVGDPRSPELVEGLIERTAGALEVTSPPAGGAAAKDPDASGSVASASVSIPIPGEPAIVISMRRVLTGPRSLVPAHIEVMTASGGGSGGGGK